MKADTERKDRVVSISDSYTRGNRDEPGTRHQRFFVISLLPSGKFQSSAPNYVMTTFYHILSNSQFIKSSCHQIQREPTPRY
jgi:hypothetical protein